MTFTPSSTDFIDGSAGSPAKMRVSDSTLKAGTQPTATNSLLNEDWLAVFFGLLIFVLALTALVNVYLIGWAVTTSVWGSFGQALKATSKDYGWLGGIGALLATYVALTVLLSATTSRTSQRKLRFN